MKYACLIPFYNEENRIDIHRFKSIFIENEKIQFYLLNDGSKDNTGEILKQFTNFKHVSIFDFTDNRGKAEVIRNSILEISKLGHDYIGFWDSDFATPFEEYARILDIAGQEGKDIISGSRIKLKGWEISRSEYRHWASRIILTVINFLFKLDIYDTQCGCKVFNSKIINSVFQKPFYSKWLFDIEIFIRYRLNYKDDQILEVPLKKWTEIGGSKIKLSDMLSVPLIILKLYIKYTKDKSEFIFSENRKR